MIQWTMAEPCLPTPHTSHGFIIITPGGPGLVTCPGVPL